MTKPIKNMTDIISDNSHISKPFLSTLIDAVLFAKYASLTQEIKLKNLLVKACILHCSFAVEALANNMIQFISLGGKLSDSIDKLDVVSKIELFSLLTSKKKINRGCYSIQVFQYLIDIRNKYVHPKIIKNELINNNGSLTPKSKKDLSQLHITSDMKKWTDIESNICVLSLLKSIDQLLLEEIGLEIKSMSCMFMDFLSLDGMYGPIVSSEIDWSNWTQSTLSYSPKFYCDYILKRYK